MSGTTARLLARLRSLWRGLLRSRQLDADMHDEMRFHLESEAERLMREDGLDPVEARRRAYTAFGGIEKYMEAGRDVRGTRWLDAIALDTRLGIRMLLKHRGLTLVGGFAMAVAIAIGATFFEVFGEMLNPSLPVAGGERVVALQIGSSSDGNSAQAVLRDFTTWRRELQSLEQVGAFRTVQLNLVASGMSPEPIRVAELTASGFTVASARPSRGRHLVPDDERPGAVPVVVIGHQAWQVRFGGDPNIVGRTINLGGIDRTVVGVMPDAFRFPYDNQFWIPLRVDTVSDRPVVARPFYMFGRLVPGATHDTAQAELMTLLQRSAGAAPHTQERLRPRVIPYTRAHVDLSSPAMVWLVRVAQLLVGALAVVVAVNVAIVVYARTVTRIGEIAVRTALGASRLRILAQLFIEALALSGLGAAVGLVLADAALLAIQWGATVNGGVPFWIRFELSFPTVIYAVALAVIAALIIGVLPGLKATGRQLASSLHEVHGRSGTRLSGVWTGLVVAQVAVAVAVLPVAVFLAAQAVQMELVGPGVAAQKFAIGAVYLGGDEPVTDRERIRTRHLALTSRLQGEPGVDGVTFSGSIPGAWGSRRFAFDAGVDAAVVGVHESSVTSVADDLFEVYGVDVVAGRAFVGADVGADAVVVNATFARVFLGSRHAIGARFHYVSADDSDAPVQSYQIVGVVRDFANLATPLGDAEPVIYHPAALGSLHPFVLSVRFAGAVPPDFAARFRAIGAEVDSSMQIRRAMPMADFFDDMRMFWRYLSWAVGLVTASVLLLSGAGIYALMSFTVAQRSREIGIRAALGALPRALLFSIFGRAMRQLTIGLVVGSILSGVAFTGIGVPTRSAATLLTVVAAMMLTVGLIAALGPARRGLRVQASDALRAD